MSRPLPAIAVLTILAATPAFAADPQPWPWKAKLPPDLALVVLSTVKSVTAKIDNAILRVSVEAEAPTPNYSEFQLTPRMGDPNDRIFVFDARGRSPDTVQAEVLSPATIEAAYSGAPIGKFDVIEIYGTANCMGYSVKDNKPVECTSKPPAPQPQP
jgi:hypothetical protein